MSSAPNPNSSSVVSTGDDWFTDLGLMDTSINNTCEDFGISVLEKIHNEEFFSLAANNVQQQEESQQQPRQSTSSDYFPQLPQQSYIPQNTHAQTNYLAPLPESNFSNPICVTGIASTIGIGGQDVHQNYGASAQLYPDYTQSSSTSATTNLSPFVTSSTSQNIVANVFAEKYVIQPVQQTMSPLQSHSVAETVTPKPKKQRKPRAPKKLNETVSVVGHEPVQPPLSGPVTPNVMATQQTDDKKPKSVRKPRGSRKKTPSQLQFLTSEAIASAVNQVLPESGQTEQVQGSSCTAHDSLMPTTKIKAPRKYYPRKPKPKPESSQDTQEPLNPNAGTKLSKPKKPRNPKKSQPVKTGQVPPTPSDQRNAAPEDLSLYFGPSDPSVSTNSQLTLHYEQQSMNLLNQKVAGQVPSFLSGAGEHNAFNQQQVLTGSGKGSEIMSSLPVSVFKGELNQQILGCNMTYSSPKPVRQYGQASSFTTKESSLFDMLAAQKYEHLHGLTNANFVPENISTLQQQVIPSSSSTLVCNVNVKKERQRYKSPIPGTTSSMFSGHVALPGTAVIKGGFKLDKQEKQGSPLLSNSPAIEKMSDLTLYERECLRRYRQAQNLANTSDSGINRGIGDTTELSADELAYLMARREGRKMPRGGHKSKKKEKLSKPSYLLYPSMEPRRCTLPKAQSAVTAAAVSKPRPDQQLHGDQTPSLQPFSHAFRAYSQIGTEGQSTYEQTINLLRPALATSIVAASPNSRPTIVQPSCHSYPAIISNPTFQFPTMMSVLPSPSGPSISTPTSAQCSYQPQNCFKASSIDSIIKRVSSEGSEIQGSHQGQVQQVPAVPVCLQIGSSGERNKESRKLTTKQMKDTPNPKPDSKQMTIGTQPVEIKVKNKGPPHASLNQKTKTKKSKDSFDGLCATEGSDKPKRKDGRGRPRKSVQALQPISDMPQDLSLQSSSRSLEIVASRAGTVEQSNHFKSLREFLAAGNSQDVESISASFDQSIKISPPTLGMNRAITFDNRMMTKPNISSGMGMSSLPAQSGLSESLEDHIFQLQRMKITSGSGDPNCQKVQNSGIGGSTHQNLPISYESVARTGQRNFQTLPKYEQPGVILPRDTKSKKKANRETMESSAMATLSPVKKYDKQHVRDKDGQQKRNSKSPGSSTSKSPQRGLSTAVMDWMSNSLRTGETKLNINRTESVKGSASASMSMAITSGDYASIFPIKPLRKGTARIPKLTVAKNKNHSFIGGQGRSTSQISQIERVIGESGLGTSNANPNSAQIGISLMHKPKMNQDRPDRMQNLNIKQYSGKRPASNVPVARMGDPSVRNTQSNMRTVGESVWSSGGLLRNQYSNANFGGYQMDKPNAYLQGKIQLFKQRNSDDLETQELKKGKGISRNWIYSTEERHFLYSEGKYLVKREDINKKREEVDVWRIEAGFHSLKRYRPRIDFSRVFHIGENTFVPIKKDINLYLLYQPVYVTVCIETDSLQIIQYFQADRFLQHLKFMYESEKLYEDYYHLLQILVCQVMDPSVIEEAILKKPGDEQWRHSWNATEKTLNTIADRISENSRWNKSVLKTVRDWPKLIMSALKVDKTRMCEACIDTKRVSGKRVTLSGLAYDRTKFSALVEKPDEPKADIQFCHGCAIILRSWSRIVHAKNDIFGCTRQRILQLIKAAPSGTKLDPPNVRDFLMNDHNWVRRMFHDYLIVLAEGHKIIEKFERPGPRTYNH